MNGVSGIYALRNTVTNQRYVGSAVSLSTRWRQHRNMLRVGTHPNTYLQRSWRKYGEAVFTMDILEHTAAASLLDREAFWIAALRCTDQRYGFNVRSTPNSNIGLRFIGRKVRRIKTHCLHGHEFTSENTYLLTRGERMCRECSRAKHPTRWRMDSGTCPNGHVRTVENTLITKKGSKSCRDCRRRGLRAYRAKVKHRYQMPLFGE